MDSGYVYASGKKFCRSLVLMVCNHTLKCTDRQRERGRDCIMLKSRGPGISVSPIYGLLDIPGPLLFSTPHLLLH